MDTVLNGLLAVRLFHYVMNSKIMYFRLERKRVPVHQDNIVYANIRRISLELVKSRSIERKLLRTPVSRDPREIFKVLPYRQTSNIEEQESSSVGKADLTRRKKGARKAGSANVEQIPVAVAV